MQKIRIAASMLLAVIALALSAKAQFIGPRGGQRPYPTGLAICNDGSQLSTWQCQMHGGIHCVLFSDGSCQ